jgi:hypothetical protein
VKPEAARAQLEAERPVPTAPTGPWPEPGSTPGPAIIGEPPLGPSLPTRFFGTAEINPDRAGRDMGQIAEEVLQHLTTLAGAKVKVTVEVEADVPDGVNADLQRVINENCQTLRFKSHGFEKS